MYSGGAKLFVRSAGKKPGTLTVADEEWLALAGQNDWVVLMKDDAIRRRPAEIEAQDWPASERSA